jgi:hypothetical protein
LLEKANEMAHRQGFAGSVSSKRSTPSASLPSVARVSMSLLSLKVFFVSILFDTFAYLSFAISPERISCAMWCMRRDVRRVGALRLSCTPPPACSKDTVVLVLAGTAAQSNAMRCSSLSP